jgi:hypothetical protein
MSQPKINKKIPQFTPDQLKEAMARHEQQKVQEQEQQAMSEFKVWQLNIFKQRSAFWQQIYAEGLDRLVKSNMTIGIINDLPATSKLISGFADAALEQWDERFLPKPPVSETQSSQEDQSNAQPN